MSKKRNSANPPTASTNVGGAANIVTVYPAISSQTIPDDRAHPGVVRSRRRSRCRRAMARHANTTCACQAELHARPARSALRPAFRTCPARPDSSPRRSRTRANAPDRRRIDGSSAAPFHARHASREVVVAAPLRYERRRRRAGTRRRCPPSRRRSACTGTGACTQREMHAAGGGEEELIVVAAGEREVEALSRVEHCAQRRRDRQRVDVEPRRRSRSPRRVVRDPSATHRTRPSRRWQRCAVRAQRDARLGSQKTLHADDRRVGRSRTAAAAARVRLPLRQGRRTRTSRRPVARRCA